MKNSFIEGFRFDDLSVCDEVINYFNNHPNKEPGKSGTERTINKAYKDSTDLAIMNDNDEPIKKYLLELQKVLDKYLKVYVYMQQCMPATITEGFNLQHYAPGQGFHVWHCERISGSLPNAARALAFMTYLNDVTDAGETEFFYQDIKFQPRKGMTLMWPADWTHTHRGVSSPTQDKYIATGWISFTS